jgi:hypothetical protein
LIKIVVIMKPIISLLLAFYLVSANVAMDLSATGSLCASLNGVFINSFFLYPNPVQACKAQTIYMTGTFDANYCVDQILIRQVYNQTTVNDQVVANSECYSKNQQVTFTLNFMPAQCVAGNYLIEVIIQTGPPNRLTLSCWQYGYSI